MKKNQKSTHVCGGAFPHFYTTVQQDLFVALMQCSYDAFCATNFKCSFTHKFKWNQLNLNAIFRLLN